MRWLGRGFATLLALWLLLEVSLRLYLEWPLATDFYGSIPRPAVRAQQERVGVRAAAGRGWAHFGWIADPDRERYRIERSEGGAWQVVGRTDFGSYLVRQPGVYRVWAEPGDGGGEHLVGEAVAQPESGVAEVHVPRIAGPWRKLFRPALRGDYMNDHTVYRDAHGSWRIVGITAKGDGNYGDEKYFAVGASGSFPPAAGMMKEEPAIADFGQLAWAPHVLAEGGTYYMFWSPHRLHRMTSPDGIGWSDHRIVMQAPFHRFFRDPMVMRVADGQWLLYTTARGLYFSRVDLYQSFDLESWQYVGAALATGCGSERNSTFASTESPAVVRYRHRYYLSLTYNNDSFAWSAILLALGIWRDRDSYNDTLVFHSDNPYDFGTYRGGRGASSLVTRLRAHAGEWVRDPDNDRWYITTAGWPWVATLTAGEVAVAPVRWDRKR